MKNITSVVTKADIHDYVHALWKTDIFRDAHMSGSGFVFDIVDRFAWFPRLFCDMTDGDLERAHFATWWGVMVRRDDYTNPIIHDLYLLHEFFHAGSMPYVPGIGKVAWDEKMQRNELEAATASEIQVYFEIPELRAMSFNYPIYADRFLDSADFQILWKNNRKVAIEHIRSIRQDVMHSKSEHEMDTIEKWIRRFAEQNATFTITWADRYPEIEERMYRFQIMANDRRHFAAEAHKNWIELEASNDKFSNIPFRQEAELFSPFYWANKAKFEKAMRAG